MAGKSRPHPMHPLNKQKSWLTKQKTSDSYKNLPHPAEDVVKSVKKDVESIKKSKVPSKTALGNTMRKEAGERAVKRMLGRAGSVGIAAGAGYDVGRGLNNKFGISDGIVNAVGPSKAEKQVNLDYRKDSEMDKFKSGPKMDDEDGKRLRDINAHKWKGTM